MAWNQAAPATNEKIRNLSSVITANWKAIEEAEDDFRPWAVNLIDRATTGDGNDPSVIASTYLLYAKDVTGNTELHGRDEAGNVLQITNAGEIGVEGASGTRYRFRDLTYDGTFRYGYQALPTAWCNVNDSGTLQYGFNVASAVRDSTGVYTVTFTTPMNNANYSVVGTVQSNSFMRCVMYRTKSTTTCQIRIADQSNSGQNQDFDLIFFGGR